MPQLIDVEHPITDAVLNDIAHLPTRSLSDVVDPSFQRRPSDADFTRIAVLLARKSDQEGDS